MAIPSKDPAYDYDLAPDTPTERFLAGAFMVAVVAVLALVAAAVFVWTWRTLL